LIREYGREIERERARRGREGGGREKVEKYGVAWKGFCEFLAINQC
jgi:hypothetical protein